MVRTVDEGPCVFYSVDRLRFRDGRGLGAIDLRHLRGLKHRVEREIRRRVEESARDHVQVRKHVPAPQPCVFKVWKTVYVEAAADHTSADADGRVVKCKNK